MITTADTVLDGALTIASDHIKLEAEGSLVGDWPADHCFVQHSSGNRFLIAAEGENLTFTCPEADALNAALSGEIGSATPPPEDEFTAPDPAQAFDDEEAEEPTPAEAAEAGADRKSKARTVKARRLPQISGLQTAIAGGMIAAVSAFALGVYVLAGGFRETLNTDPPVVATTPTTRPVIVDTPNTSIATTTTILSAFAGTVADFATGWNTLADRLDPGLVLPDGLPPAFSQDPVGYVTVAGEADADPWFKVTGRSSGTAAGDRRVLVAMGMALAIADPSLSGNDRADLLRALGLDVTNPQLDGINGSLTHNGVTYTLVYTGGELTLTIAPAS
ncbi:MAG TPA: hypothetical protein VID03_08815 [Acidimicrobiia bacterium]